ncbi:MAG: hypothetical protein M1835_005363 [Candelina submexicana]|nr:MAG: hypothetical protein M1835_005363 [Candelina submexicana]
MHQSSVEEPRPALPSPTLTNPDMILPNGEYPRRSTPSPPPQTLRLPTSTAWAQSKPSVATSGQTGRQTSGSINASNENKSQFQPYGPRIMLAGIEEVESTPRVDLLRGSNRRRQDAASPSLASSPTLSKTSLLGRTNSLKLPEADISKRFSNGSISVMSDMSGFGEYEGLDDMGSVDEDSVIQEDEDEVSDDAEGQTENVPGSLDQAQEADMMVQEDGLDDPYSHAAMSRRAERILANAKKRLGNMEGNLNRARHSLIISPSSSMSSRRDSPHTPQSPTNAASGLQGSHVHPALGVPPAKHRQLRSSQSLASGRGHSRVFSETSVPSSLHTSPQSQSARRQAIDSPRATSALGARSSGPHSNASALSMTPTIRGSKSHESVRQDLTGSRTLASHPASNSRSPTNRQLAGLHPLVEDEASQQVSNGQGDSSHTTSAFPNQPTFDATNVLTRSRSTMQMRDLQDHMQDLKGRISTLKEKARADRLTRRSLQSLRTPSPFTAAEMWYLGSDTSRDQSWNGFGPGPYNIHGEEPAAHAPDETDEPVVEQQFQQASFSNDQSEDARLLESSKTASTTVDERGAIDVQDPANLEPMRSESIDGEESYHDTSPLPLGERHEDRADAFDYENLFLHSGVGNYTQPQLARRRSTSFGSTDSVETTRGPEIQSPTEESWYAPRASQNGAEKDEFAPQTRHQRNNSVDTVSTMATFATATEGRGSEENSEDEDWDHSQRLQSMHVPGAFGAQPQLANGSLLSGARHQWPERIESTSAATKGSDLTQKARMNGYSNTLSSISSFSDTCSSDSSQTTTRSFPITNGLKHTDGISSHHPTSIFISSLTGPGPSTSALHLSKQDRALLENVLESFRKVCIHLHTEGEHSGRYDATACRSRLDEARRVLDGELDDNAVF